jgi:hypothetical protein
LQTKSGGPLLLPENKESPQVGWFATALGWRGDATFHHEHSATFLNNQLRPDSIEDRSNFHWHNTIH